MALPARPAGHTNNRLFRICTTHHDKIMTAYSSTDIIHQWPAAEIHFKVAQNVNRPTALHRYAAESAFLVNRDSHR